MPNWKIRNQNFQKVRPLEILGYSPPCQTLFALNAFVDNSHWIRAVKWNFQKVLSLKIFGCSPPRWHEKKGNEYDHELQKGCPLNSFGHPPPMPSPRHEKKANEDYHKLQKVRPIEILGCYPPRRHEKKGTKTTTNTNEPAGCQATNIAWEHHHDSRPVQYWGTYSNRNSNTIISATVETNLDINACSTANNFRQCRKHRPSFHSKKTLVYISGQRPYRPLPVVCSTERTDVHWRQASWVKYSSHGIHCLLNLTLTRPPVTGKEKEGFNSGGRLLLTLPT